MCSKLSVFLSYLITARVEAEAHHLICYGLATAHFSTIQQSRRNPTLKDARSVVFLRVAFEAGCASGHRHHIYQSLLLYPAIACAVCGDVAGAVEHQRLYLKVDIGPATGRNFTIAHYIASAAWRWR